MDLNTFNFNYKVVNEGCIHGELEERVWRMLLTYLLLLRNEKIKMHRTVSYLNMKRCSLAASPDGVTVQPRTMTSTHQLRASECLDLRLRKGGNYITKSFLPAAVSVIKCAGEGKGQYRTSLKWTDLRSFIKKP
jgi:hypothetical protein